MFKQLILLVFALAFVCLGNGVVLRDSEYDSRPVVQVSVVDDKYVMTVPVIEDLEFSEASRKYDIKSTKSLTDLGDDIARDLIVRRKQSYSWMFVTFVKLTKAIIFGFINDPKRGGDEIRIHYSDQMSTFLNSLAESDSDTLLSDAETYERVAAVFQALNAAVEESPVGNYLDIAKAMVLIKKPDAENTGGQAQTSEQTQIEGAPQSGPESILEFMKPVIHWFRHNDRKFVINRLRTMGSDMQKNFDRKGWAQHNQRVLALRKKNNDDEASASGSR